MTFDDAIAILFAIEGVHSNDPQDPGGDTWYGLSRRANSDMPWPPTKVQVVARMRERYWEACRCDELPDLLKLLVFDTAVNHGSSTAVHWLQQALRVPPDGIVGPQTIRAAASASAGVVLDVLALRAENYVGDADFAHAGKGWMRRLFFIDWSIACTTGSASTGLSF